MEKQDRTLPGTVMPRPAGTDAEDLLNGLFSAGGLVLSQVSALTGLEGYQIQNWVKRGFMTPTVGKRYSKNQFCRLITINLLKDCLSLPEIAGLLSCINGQLDDESDDLIDDSLLYVYFTKTLESSTSYTEESFRRAAQTVSQDFDAPDEDARQRLRSVLCVMCVAYVSSVTQKTARDLLGKLPSPAPARNEKTL